MLQQKMSAPYFQRADSGTSASVLCDTRGHSAVGAIVYDIPKDKVLVSLLRILLSSAFLIVSWHRGN